MIKIVKLTKYSEDLADRIRALLVQLSRSGRDNGPIPKTWFDELIASPWHDCLLAVEIDNQETNLKGQSKNEENSQNENKIENQLEFSPSQILGMASVSAISSLMLMRNGQRKKAARISNLLVVKAAKLPKNSIMTTAPQSTTPTFFAKS